MTLPVGAGPAPPLPTLTVSRGAVPGEAPAPEGLDVLDSAGSRQDVSGIGPVKSLRPAVNDWAVRVWGRKVLKQPVNVRPRRSMPPSIRSLGAISVVVFVILSRQTQPPQAIATELTVKTMAVLPARGW